jgi:hypothetical protein
MFEGGGRRKILNAKSTLCDFFFSEPSLHHGANYSYLGMQMAAKAMSEFVGSFDFTEMGRHVASIAQEAPRRTRICQGKLRICLVLIRI